MAMVGCRDTYGGSVATGDVAAVPTGSACVLYMLLAHWLP